jgi:hypothetical protein
MPPSNASTSRTMRMIGSQMRFEKCHATTDGRLGNCSNALAINLPFDARSRGRVTQDLLAPLPEFRSSLERVLRCMNQQGTPSQRLQSSTSRRRSPTSPTFQTLPSCYLPLSVASTIHAFRAVKQCPHCGPRSNVNIRLIRGQEVKEIPVPSNLPLQRRKRFQRSVDLLIRMGGGHLHA